MNKNFFRATCIISALYVIAHLIAAVLLCRERLFLDTAYYFFRVVSGESIHIEHQRIILALSQILLWAGVKLHLSLHMLMVLYSVTPIVYTALLIFISLYFFRSAAAAWMLICCNVCGTYFLYYSPMYEVCYAIVTFGFLWFLTIEGYYKNAVQMIVYMSLLALCLLGYPVIAMGCVALFSYMWVYEGKIPKRLLICHAIVFAIWILIKTFWISDYEKAHVRVNADKGKVHDVVSQVFSLSYFLGMGYFALIHYFLPLCATIGAAIWSWSQKKYMQAAWVLTWFIFLMIFMNLKAGGDGLIPTIHNERSYLIMVPICLAPLLYYMIQRWQALFVSICLIVLTIDTVYESIHTWKHSSYYALRLHYMDELVDKGLQKGCTKQATPVTALPKELNEWSTGIEVMIRSTDKGKSVGWVDKEVYDSVSVAAPIDNKHILLSMNIDPLTASELNPRYFKMDTSAYCIENK